MIKKNTDIAHKNMAASVLNFNFNKKLKNYSLLISPRCSKNRRSPNIIFAIDIWKYMVGVDGHRLDRNSRRSPEGPRTSSLPYFHGKCKSFLRPTK